jgi:hypothetical protein
MGLRPFVLSSTKKIPKCFCFSEVEINVFHFYFILFFVNRKKKKKKKMFFFFVDFCFSSYQSPKKMETFFKERFL